MAELLSFEDYVVLMELPGRCNRMRPNGKLCYHVDFQTGKTYPSEVTECRSIHPETKLPLEMRIERGLFPYKKATLTWKILAIIYLRGRSTGASFSNIYWDIFYLQEGHEKREFSGAPIIKRILRKLKEQGKIECGKMFWYENDGSHVKRDYCPNKNCDGKNYYVFRYPRSYFISKEYMLSAREQISNLAREISFLLRR